MRGQGISARAAWRFGAALLAGAAALPAHGEGVFRAHLEAVDGSEWPVLRLLLEVTDESGGFAAHEGPTGETLRPIGWTAPPSASSLPDPRGNCAPARGRACYEVALAADGRRLPEPRQITSSQLPGRSFQYLWLEVDMPQGERPARTELALSLTEPSGGLRLAHDQAQLPVSWGDNADLSGGPWRYLAAEALAQLSAPGDATPGLAPASLELLREAQDIWSDLLEADCRLLTELGHFRGSSQPAEQCLFELASERHAVLMQHFSERMGND
ncbi:MAG: hypothetical protein Q4F71_08360 [Paracoccus sp. (in: a-proteobacteria)]|nr:hypothetical protein [Paracoccus sp. (in: a-proteobacteria)]